MAGGSIIILPC